MNIIINHYYYYYYYDFKLNEKTEMCNWKTYTWQKLTQPNVTHITSLKQKQPNKARQMHIWTTDY